MKNIFLIVMFGAAVVVKAKAASIQESAASASSPQKIESEVTKVKEGPATSAVAEDALLQQEEFQRWLKAQGEQTVQKIMDKISSPDDTVMQHQAKIVVARYLVNVTLTAMTKRLLKYGRDLPDSAYFKSEFITAPNSNLPSSNNPNQEAGANPPSYAAYPAELFINSPPPSSLQIPFPPSFQNQLETGIAVTPIFVYRGANNETIIAGIPESSNDKNETGGESSTSKPIWQQVLSLNFSALGGGNSGGGNRLPFNFTLPVVRPLGESGGNSTSFRIPLVPFNFSFPSGGAGPRLPSFNLSALGSSGNGGEGGGPRLPFNLTFPSAGGEGGAVRLPFNLSLSGGEGGPRLPFNLSLSGGEGVPRLPFNLSALGGVGGGEGGPIRLPFNLSFPSGGGANGIIGFLIPSSNNGNVSEGGEGGTAAGAGGVSFNFGPPEGFLVFPTSPPMNDSVRVSQMYLGNQVDKLVEGINNQNLEGVVNSTLNIATPSTVGVLVNSLLNIVLCNPLDRWNGNCGE